MNKIRIGICSDGFSGKDTVAEMLAEVAGMRYVAGTSFFARKLVFERMTDDGIIYRDADHCWSDRRNHRMRWAQYIGEFNSENPIRLYQECIKGQDFLTGIRWRHEFNACKNANLVDIWLWIDRPGLPKDPSNQITKEDCDRVIVNDGGLPELSVKCAKLAKDLGILR